MREVAEGAAMDLPQVRSWRRAEVRGDLVLAPGERVVAGGTWLFSQPQPQLTGLVDLMPLGWPAYERTRDGISISATCTVAQLRALAATRPDLLPGRSSLARLVADCALSFLMSFKVQHVATVGGNVALALPAAAMVSLLTALEAVAVVWTSEDERRVPVLELVTGAGRTSLAPGEVLRSFEVSAAALTARYAFRRTSLTRFGRAAAVVVARRDDRGTALLVTAATSRPVRLPGDADALAEVDCWHGDVHGDPDWRAAMTRRLAAEALTDVAGGRS